MIEEARPSVPIDEEALFEARLFHTNPVVDGLHLPGRCETRMVGVIQELLMVAFLAPRENIPQINPLFAEIPFEERAARGRRKIQILRRRLHQDLGATVLVKILLGHTHLVAMQNLVRLALRREELAVERLAQVGEVESSKNAVPVSAVALPRPKSVQCFLSLWRIFVT